MPVYKDNRNNSYYFKVCINGRQFLRRGFSTKKEASFEEAIFVSQNKENRNTKEFTYLELLEKYKKYLKNELKITVYSKTVKTINNFYSNLFKNVKISKLLYSDVLNARKIIDNKKIIVSEKNKHRNFLIRFFRWVRVFYDYDFYLIERMQKFKDYSIKKKKKKIEMVQYDEFKKIYKLCDSNYYRLAFLTFYLFGLRLGELLALTVDAFDFEDRSFEVYQEVSFKTGNGGFVIIPPKSESSKRFYRMPEEYISLVKKHISDNKLNAKDYIFYQYSKNKKSAPCPEQTFRTNANNYCRVISPEFHFHMLRKSNVTYLHDKSIHLEEIKKYIGHSSSDITKNVYLQTSIEKENAILSILKETIDSLK